MFSGPNFTAALRDVKRELGEDALILGTRELSGGGVEITAATDVDRVERPMPDPPPSGGARLTQAHRPDDVLALLSSFGAQLRRVERQLPAASTRAPIEADLDPEARQLAEALSNHGLVETLAHRVAEDFSERRVDGATFDDAIAAAIVGVLPAVGTAPAANIRFVVGPTGSGKTTTIAKLAAEAVVAGYGSPLLLNADTMRIGAGEQLAGVARALDLEVRNVSGLAEMKDTLASADPDRLVYVDTAGLSSDWEIASSIRSLVESSKAPTAVTAVVSATTSKSALQRAWVQMETLQPESFAVTHVDESDEPGTACSWLGEVGVPLRWLGTGQRVPEDLVEASGANLALWLVAA